MTTVEESDPTSDGSPAVADTTDGSETGWDWPSLMPWRDQVNALLDLDEETFSRDQEPHEYHCLSGWEDAVKGWRRVAPLVGVFQAQRRGKKLKAGEPEPHCLLCVEAKPPDSDAGPKSPRADPRPRAAAVNKTVPSTLLLPAGSSPETEALCAMQTAAHNLSLREKMAEEEAPPSQGHELDSECPAIRSRQGNYTHGINSFTVLPPVKSPWSKPQALSPGPRTVEGRLWEEAWEDIIASTRESRGVERGEETRAHAVAHPGLPQDTYGAPLASKYCTGQHHHRLFCVSVPKRYMVPLSSIGGTVPCPCHQGRPSRQTLRGGSGYSAHHRPEQPQLPMLMVTKVPMPVSAQRLL